MILRLIIPLFALLAISCKPTQTPLKMAQDTIVLIGKGNLYGSGKEAIPPHDFQITTTEEWTDLLSKMNNVNKVSDTFSETDIDFSKFDVIAVFDEVRTSGGYALDLEVKAKKDATEVRKKLITPSGMATSVMTQPYYIVKVLKRNVPVIFIDK